MCTCSKCAGNSDAGELQEESCNDCREKERIRQYYIDKLMQYPEQFKKAYFEKNYGRAKYIYDSFLRIAEFIELPENIKRRLAGWESDETNIEEPLFAPELVHKAYDYCVIKLYQGYENESYRRFGEPPRYYPYPRYPVPGYPKEE